MCWKLRRLRASGQRVWIASEQDGFSFDLNVKSMHRTIQASAGMLKKKAGSIVNIPPRSRRSARPDRYAYAPPRGGDRLTKAVAADFIRQDRVNAMPGKISPFLGEPFRMFSAIPDGRSSRPPPSSTVSPWAARHAGRVAWLAVFGLGRVELHHGQRICRRRNGT